MDEQNQNQQDQQQNQNAGQTPEGSQNSGGGLSFDELLKQHPEYQSEFDRRMTKGVATARSRWEQEQADSQDEAKKVARMTEAQRERYQLDKGTAEPVSRMAGRKDFGAGRSQILQESWRISKNLAKYLRKIIRPDAAADWFSGSLGQGGACQTAGRFQGAAAGGCSRFPAPEDGL